MSTSLQLFNSKVTVDNYNNDFLLIRPALVSETAKIGKAIFQKQFDFAAEVIVTEVEICIKLNANFTPSNISALKTIESKKKSNHATYRLPVYFGDHQDWLEVESVTGFDKQEIIAKLLTLDFSIAMFGFLPGFVYLNGLDSSLHVPRKTVPSKYVKANSIAIGGKYLGLYALDSPGGWQVIGRMAVSVLQIPELPPLVLNPGDEIRLQAIEKEEYESLLEKQMSLKEYNT